MLKSAEFGPTKTNTPNYPKYLQLSQTLNPPNTLAMPTVPFAPIPHPPIKAPFANTIKIESQSSSISLSPSTSPTGRSLPTSECLMGTEVWIVQIFCVTIYTLLSQRNARKHRNIQVSLEDGGSNTGWILKMLKILS